jgi:hypothetical protein
MTEARQLKAGRWRIYVGPGLNLVRDPSTGSIATFDSLAAACQWWAQLRPGEAPLREAKRCARCGGYFGPAAGWTLYAGRYYHPAHRPGALDAPARPRSGAWEAQGRDGGGAGVLVRVDPDLREQRR